MINQRIEKWSNPRKEDVGMQHRRMNIMWLLRNEEKRASLETTILINSYSRLMMMIMMILALFNSMQETVQFCGAEYFRT